MSAMSHPSRFAVERLRPGSARGRLVILLLILPITLICGCLAGFAIGRIASPPSDRDQRLARIAADPRGVSGDHLLALGDSHVARWRTQEICGLPLLNASVQGATARDTEVLVAGLPLPRPPRAIILTVGTDDANRKRFREAPEAVIRFRDAFRALLKRVSRRSDLILVTSLPPMDARQVPRFSADVSNALTAIALASCRENAACRVAEGFGEGVPLDDGLHLANDDGAYATLAPRLCAALPRELSIKDGAATRQNPGADAP